MSRKTQEPAAKTCRPPQIFSSGAHESSNRFSPTVGKCTLASALSPLPSMSMITPSPHCVCRTSSPMWRPIVSAPDGGFAVLPGNEDLTLAEVNLLQEIGREMKLKKALAPVAGLYDFILIDCPPSINMLTVNALTAADGVLIPMQCEYYALEGLSSLLRTIEQVRDSVNPTLEMYGILRTMFDPRVNLSNEVSMQLIEHFDRKVFRTVVPRNIRLAEAPSFGLPVLLHDRSSRGAIAYLALAGEILRREDDRMAEAV